MKNYACDKCGSVDVFLKEKNTNTGLYCGDCGAWLKWVSKKELPLVERFIESNKVEVLDTPPRKVVKVKAKINNIKNSDKVISSEKLNEILDKEMESARKNRYYELTLGLQQAKKILNDYMEGK